MSISYDEEPTHNRKKGSARKHLDQENLEQGEDAPVYVIDMKSHS